MSSDVATRRIGMVSVVGGELRLDADPDGAPAVVIPGEGVTIRRGGQDAGNRVELYRLDDIEIDVGSCDPVSTVTVAVSADGLSARLTASGAPGLRYTLEDRSPAPEIVLNRTLIERIEGPGPTEDAAQAALAEAGVMVGIMQGEVAAALRSVDGTGRVVARGSPPQPPVDADVTIHFAEALAANALHTVPRGTPLATKTPCRPGVPGQSVTGEPIAAREPKDAPLAAGMGTVREMADDGTITLIAGVDGRPALAGAMVLVEERITLNGDVDVATGDVEVLASLVVTGSVEEGRAVRAKHSLEIVGGVDRADLEAGGSLTITGSCVHSRLRAGGRQAVLIKLLTALGDTPDQLEVMAAIVDQLMATGGARGQELRPGAALVVLLEGKFSHVRTRMHDAMEVIRRHEPGTFEDAVVAAVQAVHHVVDGLGAHELYATSQLRGLVGRLAMHVAAMRRQVADPAEVRVAYLQACELEASGGLVLTGQGVFNSEIFVGGDLTCDAPTSTLRGGSATVGGSVRVHELGGAGGSRVEVVLEGPTTTPDRLHADVVHHGVHVRVGAVEFDFEEPSRDVRLGLDDEGRVRRM